MDCLLDKLDDERMTDDCEEKLLEIQYFVVRDFRFVYTAILQFHSHSVTDWPFAKVLMICQYSFQIHCWLLKWILNMLKKYEISSKCSVLSS